jgi:hypothetical protein
MALVIEAPVLELLGADADTVFDVSTNGEALVLTPVRDATREDAFRESLQRVNREQADDLRKLAE